jgi:hypothetical protein
MKSGLLMISILFIALQSTAQKNFSIAPDFRKGITQNLLEDVNTLSDINSGYPSSWINNYQSVELIVSQDGKEKSYLSNDENLSPEQKTALVTANIWSTLSFNILYFPENEFTLTPKQINFKYTIVPEVEASYPAGYEALDRYFVEKEFDKIATNLLTAEQQIVLRFTVDAQGNPGNVVLDGKSENIELDKKLIRAIEEMKRWKPALDSKGNPITQDFVISIGMMVGC